MEPVAAPPARRLVLAGPPEIVAVVSPELLRLALLGKAVSAGDNVSLLPLDITPTADARRRSRPPGKSLANMVGYAWTSTLLDRGRRPTRPGCALVTADTVVGWRDGPATQRPGETTTVGAAEHGRGAQPRL